MFLSRPPGGSVTPPVAPGLSRVNRASARDDRLLVAPLGRYGIDEPEYGRPAGEDVHHAGLPPDLPVRPLPRVGGPHRLPESHREAGEHRQSTPASSSTGATSASRSLSRSTTRAGSTCDSPGDGCWCTVRIRRVRPPRAGAPAHPGEQAGHEVCATSLPTGAGEHRRSRIRQTLQCG